MGSKTEQTVLCFTNMPSNEEKSHALASQNIFKSYSMTAYLR